MSTTTSEPRNGELPIPYVDAPVGTLDYDGHEIAVWSIATTTAGHVIYLNCSAADAAVSATLKRLLRKSSGKAIFQPAKGISWSGPFELSKLTDHYDTVTQALTHKGLRLKNKCIIPDCLNIAAGLSRPMDSDQDETPFLVKPKSIQIIVGRNQPEACTAHLQCHVFDSIEQECPNSLARSQAIDTHDFACLPLAMIRYNSNIFALLFGNETR
jgi:hypothetical protein